MRKVKHTRGPWTLREGDGFHFEALSESDPSYKIIHEYVEKAWDAGNTKWEDPRSRDERFPYSEALTIGDIL